MKENLKGILIYVAIFLVLVVAASFMLSGDGRNDIGYSEVVTLFNNSEVTEFSLRDNTVYLKLKDGSQKKSKLYSVSIFYEDLKDTISEQTKNGTLKKYNYEPPSALAGFMNWLPTILLLGGMVVITFMMFRRMGDGGKANAFTKSRAKVGVDNGKKVTFKDVAGVNEEKEELSEIVDFLKNPRKFISIGARIPKGVLLVGPPGTGKTLLAKAVAGEAGVPFFSISGSDFVELYVGVGASRVRDLFGTAKKNAPCIIFIDEIDAVGRRRGAGLGGGHDEREQTLNQMLVEMDGFGANEGVIVMAATNRADVLDPALLRPGRFDRQVAVGYPDIKGREEILKVHAKNKVLDSDVDLNVVAKGTVGFTGADLENALNEAALLAAREKRTSISMKNIEDAIIKVIVGPEKKSRKISDRENRLTAFHEAGHAITSQILPTQDPVHMISIIPTGRAGGYTLNLPVEDKSYASKKEMIENIIVLLGGRAAEALMLDDISTGASNDIQRATGIARDMVTKYGMSERLGPMMFGNDNDEVFIGRDFGHTRNYSENVAAQIDEEIKMLIDDCYEKAQEILRDNKDKLIAVAEKLLEHEKLLEDEFEVIFKGEEDFDEYMSKKKEKEAAEKAERERLAKEREAAEKAEQERKAREEAEKRKQNEPQSFGLYAPQIPDDKKDKDDNADH